MGKDQFWDVSHNRQINKCLVKEIADVMET